jgi:hypothetical protein
MTLTPESRVKALEARKAAIANNPYRKDWMEAPIWDSLAQKRGIRLPMWHKPPTPRLLKRWHQSLTREGFEAAYGCSPSRLIALNPQMPLRAFIGQMLELADLFKGGSPFATSQPSQGSKE